MLRTTAESVERSSPELSAGFSRRGESDRKVEGLERKERALDEREEGLESLRVRAESLVTERKLEFERVSG